MLYFNRRPVLLVNVFYKYVPALGDMVIGIVTDRLSEGWKIDIGTHTNASLSIYAFEGGNKKNRANLEPNSIVYCRVKLANKDVEPECECVNQNGKADGFGPLVGGYLFRCSTGLARQCLNPESSVLNEVGKQIPFEIAVGINGYIWVRSTSSENTILIANAIIASEHLDSDGKKEVVKNLLNEPSN